MRKLLTLLLLLCLCIQPAAAEDAPGHFSGARFFADQGYGVYARVSAMEPGAWEATVTLQIADDPAIASDIAGFTLVIGEATAVPLGAVAEDTYGRPTMCYEIVRYDGPAPATMRLVPVFSNGVEDLENALALSPATDGWDAEIGTAAFLAGPTDGFTAPDAAAPVFMRYEAGVPVTIANVLPEGWRAVVIGERIAFMRADALTDHAAADHPTQVASVPFLLYYSNYGVATLMDIFPAGTAVDILGTADDGWQHVVIGPQWQAGYIAPNALAAAEGPLPVMPYYQEQGLRYYGRNVIVPSGYVVRATVSEFPGGFGVNIGLFAAEGQPIEGFALYANGAYVGQIGPMADAAGQHFYADVALPDVIEGLRLVPIGPEGEMTADAAEII